MAKKIKPDQYDYNDVVGIYKRRLYNNNGLHKLKFYDITRDFPVTLMGGVEDFSDSYNSNWTDDDVYGKQDPMAIFANTRRNISVSCVLPAYSFIEAEQILEKCQRIAAGMYPDYTRINGIKLLKTAPLWKVKWGNLITGGRQNFGTAKRSGLTCRIDSFEYTPDLEANVSVIGKLAPMVTRVSFSLTPFHDHTVGSTYKKSPQHFPYNSHQKYGAISSGEIDRYFGDDKLWSSTARLATHGQPLRVTRIQEGKNKGKYMVFTTPEKGTTAKAEGYIITPDLAGQLARSGYKVTASEGALGFDIDPTKDDFNVPATSLQSLASGTEGKEGRKVLQALKDQFLKQIRRSSQK
jgi:hypothetical protein